MLRHLYCEDSRWLTIQGAVWSDFVVVFPPFDDDASRLARRSKPVLLEASFAKLTVERFNECILRWLDDKKPYVENCGLFILLFTAKSRALVTLRR